jgi:peptide deformylase
MKKQAFLFLTVILFIISCGKTRTQEVDPNIFTEQEKAFIRASDSDAMMKLYTVNVFNDSLVLRNRCFNVIPKDPALEYLLSRMLQTVKNPQNLGVGIAAPQVGINRRVIWVQRYDIPLKPWHAILNPKIIAHSDTVQLGSEGCLSLPGLQGNVNRWIWITVEYDARNGVHKIEKITHPYAARIFQHEIDHLDRILYIDRM